MLKRNLVLLLLIVFACSTAGITYYYYLGRDKRAGENGPVVNNTGDHNSRSENKKDAAPGPAAKASEKDSGHSLAPAVLPGNTPQAGDEKTKEHSTGESDPLRSRIEQKYTAMLQDLTSRYEGRLNGMVLSGLNECRAARIDDPKADLTPIINRYKSAGKALEAECDQQFYSILAEFEAELKANSFPLDAAVAARKEYNGKKSLKMEDLKP